MKLKKLFILLVVCLISFSFGNVSAQDAGTFSELQQLINDATGTLKLEKDYVNSGSEAQLEITKDLTLDLNGHIINANQHGRVFYIHNNANVIIDDSSKNIVHKFSVEQGLEISYATLNEASGTFEVNGGCITGGSSDANGGSGIYVSGAQLTMKAGNIIGNKGLPKNSSGLGIHLINNAKFVLDGGLIAYNYNASEGLGGGVYVNNSEFIMNGGSVNYNFGIYGGGIAVHNDGKLTINDGTIKGNTVGHNGAGIVLYKATAVINDCVIEENINPATWIGFGGGISTEMYSNLTMYGGIIRNNKANRGAGIAAWTGGNIKLYGGTITGNVSTEDTTPGGPNTYMNYGGGIFFDVKYSGYGYSPVSLTLGKDIVIKDNFNEVTKKEENLYFTNGQTINIGTGVYAPSDKMDVGITMANIGTFTGNVLEDYGYGFSYDAEGYSAVKENDVLKFVLDNENPTGKITLKGNIFTSFLNTITFGLLFNEKADVIITAEDDTAIKSIEYYIANEEMTLDEVKGITSWKKYSKFTIDEDNEYIIYAKIIDRSDKITYISSNGFILDTTPALIEGLENNKEYYATQKFSVSDKYLDIVKINDKEVTDYTLEGNIDKTYTVEALDKAGNITKYTITMKKVEELGNKIKDITEENVKKEDKPIIVEVKDIIENDTDDATEVEKEELDDINKKCDSLLSAIEKLEENPNTADTLVSCVVIGIISITFAISYGLYLSKKYN